MALSFSSYPLKSGQWYREKPQKKYVVWHGTMGRTRCTPSGGNPGKATSSIDGWNADELHVGAPYVVDRDGTIFKTFDDAEWIFHLGLKKTNGLYDKASVGIEFANELCLAKEGDKLHAFGYLTPNTVYTGPHFAKVWRGFHHWADLEEAQVDAGIALTLDICERYGIDPVFFYPSTLYDFPRCFQVATILCHSNCRKDKTDLLLQDWVWDKIKAAGIRVVS